VRHRERRRKTKEDNMLLIAKKGSKEKDREEIRGPSTNHREGGYFPEVRGGGTYVRA